MTGSTEQNECKAVSPGNAFALLGNETRIDIIRALGETSDTPLSFSALHDRINVADSGQFNYHLNKLVGSFVRRTDESKYELTYAGAQVVGAIYSGIFNQHSVTRSFTLDSTCLTCGSVLLAEYDREHVTISCRTCDGQKSTFAFPPGAIENRTLNELGHAFDTWLRLYLSAVIGELCLTCAGRMYGSITDGSDHLDNHEVGIKHICERCTNYSVNSVGAFLLYHPIVVAFHYDHDIDLIETPLWELSWLHEQESMVVSRDPLQVQFSSEINGNQLELLIDEDLSVSII